MAQAYKQSTDHNFKVEAVPSYMQLPNGTFAPDGFTLNRRADNLSVLGKVTERYGIVQNSELIDATEEAFAKEGLKDYTRKIIVSGEGERMYAVYDFNSRTKALSVGDMVGLRITARNSFDGSLRASLLAGIRRLVCKNGLVTIEKEVGMTRKHGSQISVAFAVEAVQKAVTQWEKSLVVFNRLSAVPITQLQGGIILERLEDSNILSGKLREGISDIWANPRYAQDGSRNLFNLYNAVTQHLTHSVENDRFELSDRVNHNVLSAFERASRDTSRLAKLVMPIEQKAQAVSLN